MTDLYKKHLITTQDWEKERLDEVLALAKEMKNTVMKSPISKFLKVKPF